MNQKSSEENRRENIRRRYMCKEFRTRIEAIFDIDEPYVFDILSYEETHKIIAFASERISRTNPKQYTSDVSETSFTNLEVAEKIQRILEGKNVYLFIENSRECGAIALSGSKAWEKAVAFLFHVSETIVLLLEDISIEIVLDYVKDNELRRVDIDIYHTHSV